MLKCRSRFAPRKPLAVLGVLAGAVAVLAVVACGDSQEPQDSESAGGIERATETVTAASTAEPPGTEGAGETEHATETATAASTAEPPGTEAVGETEHATETAAAVPTAEPLYIAGVGEVEGPVAVYRRWKFEESQEPEDAPEGLFTVFAFDLATGLSWDIYEATDILLARPAGDRLMVWSIESLAIHSVSLDGTSEVLLHSGPALAPHVSLDDSKIAFAVDGSPSGEPDSVIVLDVQSGDEVLRIEADDPRIDVQESEWSLEVDRWSVDGSALLVAGSYVLTLDGEVHDARGRLSFDLRYGAIAPGLGSGARSLTVVDIATGQDLFTLTPEQGNRILEWYWGMPASGKAMYATVPAGAVNERPARRAVWRIVDLDTGATGIVNLDEKVRAEWDWVWGLNGMTFRTSASSTAKCVYRHQALDPCIDLNVASQEALQFIYRDQERQERNASIGQTELLGFIWLD